MNRQCHIFGPLRWRCISLSCQPGARHSRNPEGFNVNSRGCNPRWATRECPALKGPNALPAQRSSTLPGSNPCWDATPWVAPTAIHVQALQACGAGKELAGQATALRLKAAGHPEIAGGRREGARLCRPRPAAATGEPAAAGPEDTAALRQRQHRQQLAAQRREFPTRFCLRRYGAAVGCGPRADNGVLSAPCRRGLHILCKTIH